MTIFDCSKNAAGHVWGSSRVDPRRSCVFCGLPGRDCSPVGGPSQSGGFFAAATLERAELFSKLRAPVSSGWKAGKS